jgi:phosphatidylinositol-3-phosphatase
MSASRRCETCGSALADDQRYCLVCGARDGAPSPLLHRFFARARQASAKPAAPTQPHDPDRPARAPRQGLRLPGPLISALLVAVFVGFGALLGSASSDSGRLADSARPLKLIVPSPSPTATATPSTHGSSPRGHIEAPEASPEPTPANTEAEEGSAKSSVPGKAPSTAGQHGAAKQTGAGGGESKPQPTKSSAGAAAKLSDIKHVFLLVLSDQPFAFDFGPETEAHYISQTLEPKGELLLRYDAIAHEGLPDGIALLSGQGPTEQTTANCPTYAPLQPGTIGADEQAQGEGCVYPAGVKTLPGQLAAKHLRWRAYVQGIDEGAATGGPCQHPASSAPDSTSTSGAYATARNPFVYFESILQSPECQADDVGLSQLASDLSGSHTPSFSYIVPDRCDDGGPTACSPGAPTGPADTQSFLEQVVPEIMRSGAYRHDGLLVITTDQTPATGAFGESAFCCGQPASYPNLPGVSGRGGGEVGALLLSPLIKGGTISRDQYNHFSLLRTIEDIFALKHLGYAGLSQEHSFATELLNAPAKG